MSSFEDLIEPSHTASKAPEVVSFFTKERSADELLAYAYEMKQQREEAEKEYKLAVDRLKALFKTDSLKEKKSVIAAGDYNLIVSKRSPSCSLDWEKWAIDTVGEDAVKELLGALALVKDNKADSKYVSRGREVTAIEIVKRESTDYPL